MDTNEVLIAHDLPDHVAGCVAFWSSGGDVDDYELLERRWREQGLPPELLLEPPTNTVAAARAVKDACLGRPHMFQRKTADGWVVVNQHESKDGVVFTSETVVKLDRVGRICFSSSSDPLLEKQIEAGYLEALDVVTASDLNRWLAGKVMDYVQAATLRESGGFYYVSRKRMQDWMTIRDVVQSCTHHKIQQITAVANDADTVNAVLAALEHEAAAFVNDVQEELDEGELGERAWNTRTSRCKAMQDKLDAFKSILGPALDKLVGQIEEVEGQTVAAALAAMED